MLICVLFVAGNNTNIGYCVSGQTIVGLRNRMANNFAPFSSKCCANLLGFRGQNLPKMTMVQN